MSREEALRALATAEDAPEKDRRIAQIMLAGPEISFTDEQRLRSVKTRRNPMAVAVGRAMAQMEREADLEREQAQAEVNELRGL